MFVQIFRGQVAGDVEDLVERWLDELRPGAVGWLGITAGTTPEGQFVAMVRFASPEDAQRNSDRPEQGAWWAEFEKRCTGAVTVHDCDEVALILDGGRDDAGFVQVIEAVSTGRVSAADLADVTSRVVTSYRPDVLGGFVAVARDGAVIEAVYFTSEAEAREHERKPLPADASAQMEEVMAPLGEPTYYDLPAPILVS